MKVLFIGGTGLISSACSQLAIERGIELFVLNRGQRGGLPAGATQIVADIKDQAATARALKGQRFDAVVKDSVDYLCQIFRDRPRHGTWRSLGSNRPASCRHW